MKVSCQIQYKAHPGSDVYISGSSSSLGKWDVRKALKMTCKYEQEWNIAFNVSERSKDIEYKYFIANAGLENIQWESGENRALRYFSEFDKIDVCDAWREKNHALDVLNKPVFKELIFKRDNEEKPPPKDRKLKTKKTLIFQVYAPKLDKKHKLCISGNVKELGEWKNEDTHIMDNCGSSTWSSVIKFTKKYKNTFYKYGIYDTVNKKVISFESGNNRLFAKPDKSLDCRAVLRCDDIYRYSDLTWHGAGVAIPIFALRSKNSMGVGEFLDIKLMVDWCKTTGIKMIQILPVNDTVCTHTWVDSYPYSAISIFALHPMYLNLQAIGDLPAAANSIVNKRVAGLNKDETIDYEAVMKIKSKFFLLAYQANKRSFLSEKAYKDFFKKNKEWLQLYAAYSYLRDLFGTHDYTKWKKYAKFKKKLIDELCSPTAKQFDDIAIHYFIQYHLHKQLLEATVYARTNGIILKGDIPIGVNRYSVDTWVDPELFYMDAQTGAPPDDFAVDGQNWGFPTYNWEEMAQDGFKWWRSRLKNLSTYFDAFRIDHILGFFRIWEIPYDAVSGLLGHFRPAIPIRKTELDSLNIGFNEERFCKPYIRSSFIYDRFGDKTQMIIDNYLDEYESGCFRMKPGFETQRQIEEYFKLTPDMPGNLKAEKTKTKIKKMLFSLISEVMFVKDPNYKDCYHPRISIDKTNSYADMGWESKNKIYNLYLDYSYYRQEELWTEQAMIKLPALINATNMLACGEDLGMVPNCLPSIMDVLGLLSLKIQRMPKEEYLDFGIPSNYPYMSVCTPSCHDMSTIRGWWEENGERRQKFYNDILGHDGEAPVYCEPWICDEIINQHLHSPSMWAVFPIQDLLAIDGNLRRKNSSDEAINDPSNPHHYWRYRFHINLEDLLKKNSFNKHVRKMIDLSGRSTIVY